MAAYHKAPRRYLGIGLRGRRPGRPLARSERGRARGAAHGLWASDIHEARIAAAKLLTQARIREDEPLVWAEFRAWVPDFDAWAIADQRKAGERRLAAEPARSTWSKAGPATRTGGSAAPRWWRRSPGRSSPTDARTSAPPASASSAGPRQCPTATGSRKASRLVGPSLSVHDPARAAPSSTARAAAESLRPREALRRL